MNAETVEHAGTATLKTLYTVNTKMKIPKHPKFYEEIRIRAREAQRSKQQASSTKQQATSSKPQAGATSNKPQAPSDSRNLEQDS
jgi:hypothetical protein